MNDTIPKYLRWILKHTQFIAIPNLGFLIAALAVLAFVGTHMLGAQLHQFTFVPEAVRAGQWWRLFAFPISQDLTNPIWLLFYVMYIYFVFNSLENFWGTPSLTFFTLFSYVCTIAAATLVNISTNIWYHVIANISLAFGTLFPEVEFYLFFILPVRAKWLTLFAGAMILLQFIVAPLPYKLFLAICMLPYLLFFSPMLLGYIKMWKYRRQNRNRIDKDMWR